MRAALEQRAVPERAHQLELPGTADERARADRPFCRSECGLDCEPGRDGLGLSLGVDGLEVLVANRVPSGAISLCSDDQASGRSGGLQPSRRY